MSKICPHCKEKKSFGQFHTDKSKRSGLSSWCKKCQSNAGKNRPRKRRSKEHSRRLKLKYKYDLTLEQHEQMYVDQDGCCAICNEPVEYSKTHTDHDHQTGKVRGILCRRCNYGMGFVDDKEFVKKAKQYLKG